MLRFDAVGRFAPVGNTVTKLDAVGPVTVTFNATAPTPDGGTPPRPSTGRSSVVCAPTAPMPCERAVGRDEAVARAGLEQTSGREAGEAAHRWGTSRARRPRGRSEPREVEQRDLTAGADRHDHHVRHRLARHHVQVRRRRPVRTRREHRHEARRRRTGDRDVQRDRTDARRRHRAAAHDGEVRGRTGAHGTDALEQTVDRGETAAGLEETGRARGRRRSRARPQRGWIHRRRRAPR